MKMTAIFKDKNLPFLPCCCLNAIKRGWGVKGVGGRRKLPPTPLLSSRKGLTFVELVIIVAIFAILSAVSYPKYRRYLLNSKASEAEVNIKSIKSLEEAYKAEKGSYLPAGPSTVDGGSDVGPTPGVFGPGPDNNSNQIPDFEELGFSPRGKVYFTYMVVTDIDSSSMAIDAKGDLDGDNALCYFTMNTDGSTAGGQSHHAPPAYTLEKSGDDY